MTSRLTPGTAGLLLVPPLMWAGNAIVGRALVGEFPPLALSFWRWALALALIAPFTVGTLWRQRALLRQWWAPLLAISAVGVGLYNSLQYLALQTASVLSVTLIAASGPVVTLLVGALAFGAAVSRAQWLGAAISATGVLLVVARGDLGNLARLHVATGDLIMLAATVSWSLYTWLLRRRRPPLGLAPFLTVQIALGATMILPFYLAEIWWGAQSIAWSERSVAGLAYVALLPSLLAYWCWDRGVARAGAVLPTVFANFTPIFAAILGFFFLGETIAWFHLAGGALILAGIAAANRPAPQAAAKQAATRAH